MEIRNYRMKIIYISYILKIKIQNYKLEIK